MIVSSCGGQHANFANDEKEHDPPQNSRRESSRPREENYLSLTLTMKLKKN
jgi:hypothetical protein